MKVGCLVDARQVSFRPEVQIPENHDFLHRASQTGPYLENGAAYSQTAKSGQLLLNMSNF